ncbi:MAG: hypothetical protein SF051_12620 [Elusimicrobiota bacterium]|nr:hypothetical protein [Elusimicrobiota bacterium]
MLAAVLRARLGAPAGAGRLRAAALVFVLVPLGLVALDWTRLLRFYGEDFPLDLPGARGVLLHLAAVLLGAAAFALAGRGALRGAAFGFVQGTLGWCAARWPVLARALELSGAGFGGPLLGALLAPALAASSALAADALARAKRAGPAAAAAAALAAGWILPTVGLEAALRVGWGFGPRSLAEAAGVPTKSDARTVSVAWLYPSRGEAVRFEERRLSDDRVDLSPESLERLDAFLRERGLRDVFADEALAALRRGWLMHWEAERALDAAMLSRPGRAAPDYRRALELLRAGPLTDERLAKLRRLDELSTLSDEGFEGVTAAQYIFEGFSGAYARFGREEDARRWLYRIDNLWPVNDKRIEVTPIEDMRDGRIEGRLLRGELPATDARVGLFFVWRSSATQSTHYFLSGSTFPDESGRFEFTGLGPGRYHLALMAEPGALGGSVAGSPGIIQLDYDRAVASLGTLRLREGEPEAPADWAERPEDLLPRGAFLPVPGRTP